MADEATPRKFLGVKRFVVRYQGNPVYAYHDVDLEIEYKGGTFTVRVERPSRR